MAQGWHTFQVQTRTPLEVLRAADAPSVIDYLSLDVEGSEMDILRAFPFEQFTILFATIETNDDVTKERELRNFMHERGYTFLGHAGTDDYFAYKPLPDYAADPPFDYTSRRDLE
mmetsp:Transcript_24019/g.39731  ORF Transcript_24019/g.39731 Transcript_24019/m.39731 type:complete len:115 (-) Transcript_24019:157-501(-)